MLGLVLHDASVRSVTERSAGIKVRHNTDCCEVSREWLAATGVDSAEVGVVYESGWLIVGVECVGQAGGVSVISSDGGRREGDKALAVATCWATAATANLSLIGGLRCVTLRS